MNLVSIIIPTYNREEKIKSAIKSILYQTNPHWELIIVDDGSQDNTKLNIEPYLTDSRIKYLYQKNRGVSSARNYGVKYARGSHLIFLDSDDELLPELIETLAYIKYFNYDLISWPVIKHSRQKEEVQYHRKLGSLYNDMEILFLAGSICYRRSFFLEVGGYDENLTFGENYELGLRISERNYNLKLIEYIGLIYNIRSHKTSNSIENRLYSGIIQYRKHRKKYAEHPFYDSEMSYILGYLFEKTGKMYTASRFYSYAWKVYLLNYKAFLKIILLKMGIYIR